MIFGKMMHNQFFRLNLYLIFLLLSKSAFTTDEIPNTKNHEVLKQLLIPFSKVQTIKLPFTEKRFSFFFKQPKQFKGIIEYTYPNLFIKHISQPFNKKFKIEKNQLTIYDDNKPSRQLSLEDYPQLKQLQVLYIGLLHGDITQLSSYYQLEILNLANKQEHTKLTHIKLTPLVDDEPSYANTTSQQIDLFFDHQQIIKISMKGVSGEYSEMSFDKALFKQLKPLNN